MTVRQLPLWEEPAAGTVVKVGTVGKVTNPDGKVTTKRGISHSWLLCTACGCGTFVKGLPPDQDRIHEVEYAKAHGVPCRMTPRCSGRHLVGREP